MFSGIKNYVDKWELLCFKFTLAFSLRRKSGSLISGPSLVRVKWTVTPLFLPRGTSAESIVHTRMHKIILRVIKYRLAGCGRWAGVRPANQPTDRPARAFGPRFGTRGGGGDEGEKKVRASDAIRPPAPRVIHQGCCCVTAQLQLWLLAASIIQIQTAITDGFLPFSVCRRAPHSATF